MTIGERIALLRKKQGLTQEQLADILGTTRQAVSKWEAGKSSPDIDYAISMGAYFGVSMDYLLLGMEDTEEKPAPLAPAPKPNCHPYRILFIVLLIIGICILLILPSIAAIYRNYEFESLGSAFTDPNLYLTRWPLKGMVFIGIGMTLFGAGGLIFSFYRRIRKEWKSQKFNQNS